MEVFTKGKGKSIIRFIQGRSGVAQLPKDGSAIDVVQQHVKVVGLIRKPSIINEDIFHSAAAFCLWGNTDVSARWLIRSGR